MATSSVQFEHTLAAAADLSDSADVGKAVVVDTTGSVALVAAAGAPIDGVLLSNEGGAGRAAHFVSGAGPIVRVRLGGAVASPGLPLATAADGEFVAAGASTLAVARSLQGGAAGDLVSALLIPAYVTAA